MAPAPEEFIIDSGDKMNTCESRTTEDSLELWRAKYLSGDQTPRNSEGWRREEGPGLSGMV